MAQTIALQRGSTSITWNGTTAYTLFTQSGGTATRVIIGGVSAYSTNNGSINMAMFVKQSGTSNYLTIGYKGVGTASSSNSLDFYGGSAITPLPAQPASTNNSAGGTPILVNSNGGFFGAGDISNTAVQAINSQFSNSNSFFQFEVCPQQFWIGPGDSVVMKFFNYSSAAATGIVAYTFTTITES